MRPLADINCTPIRFQSGDRILVKCKVPMDSYQKKRIKKSIEKWAGVSVEVLILDINDLTAFDLEIQSGQLRKIQTSITQ